MSLQLVRYKTVKPIEPRFSRTGAYQGVDRLILKPSTPAYIPNYYDSQKFINTRAIVAVLSFTIMMAYFGYFREPNDIDLILNSEPHVLAGNLERKLLKEQIEQAKRAGKPTDLLEAQLSYVDVKEAAIKATYDKKK
ncbi:unnamed protein product [Bursaphelenchus okinawaensis]|uniref:Uncharacterized protein n=1 Tax=Bursaphelenchus okinawaensis TaxID=465554 RepID=A0A811LLS8_9BILA|nr:unnamed protein product [Bursaphelenchus okinawaensis]CAG9126652.1 unnamed protein product [Bursaphelenchus okinawaensis]